MILKPKENILLALSVAIIIAVFFVDPIAQDQSYHNFADKRTLFGVANFWNVASNLPFALVGLLGFWRLYQGRINPDYRLFLHIFCLGLLFTCLGSGWYHLNPNNDSLVWDRLPMTLSFMSLFCLVLCDYLKSGWGRQVLWPLLLTGVGSVIYWRYTEYQGVGDLRLYGLVQFLPIVLMLAMLFLFSPRYGTKQQLGMLFIFYAMAKFFEFFDAPVYQVLHVVSGHTIKHISAAIGTLYVIGMAHGAKNQ